MAEPACADNRRAFNAAALKAAGETADPDLRVPPAQRTQYEAAFARFARVFPDVLCLGARTLLPDNTRDVGRHLSAGFLVDKLISATWPLHELLLDERGQQTLDAMWRDGLLASATERTYVQFWPLCESGEARKAAAGAAEDDRPPPMRPLKRRSRGRIFPRERARSAADAAALAAIEEHFTTTNAAIR